MLFLAGARSWLAAIGRAAAFAFTGVLPFAAVVAGSTAPLAFAGVLALAGVNILLPFVTHLTKRHASFAGHVDSVSLHSERTAH